MHFIYSYFSTPAKSRTLGQKLYDSTPARNNAEAEVASHDSYLPFVSCTIHQAASFVTFDAIFEVLTVLRNENQTLHHCVQMISL